MMHEQLQQLAELIKRANVNNKPKYHGAASAGTIDTQNSRQREGVIMSTKWWHNGAVGGISVPVHSGSGATLHAATTESADEFVRILNGLEGRLDDIVAFVRDCATDRDDRVSGGIRREAVRLLDAITGKSKGGV